MGRKSVTVEQVRESQENFIKGSSLHGDKNYQEAIEHFKECASINPEDETQLEKLDQTLSKGPYKLVQKSIAYMGCAATHLNSLIIELTDDEKDEVPVDKSLANVFNEWE